MPPAVLIVEDDAAIVELIRFHLEQEGYQVSIANDGEEALRKARYLRPDLVILDLMLPRFDGLCACKVLKQELDTAILIVSARRELEDRVLGLETGADDYLPKPFSPRELRARVKALLRRHLRRPATVDSGAVLRLGRIVLRPQQHEVTVDGRPVALPPKEFALLATFLAHPGQVMTHEVLLKRVWDYADALSSDSLYVHVSNLRRKVEPGSRCRIVAIKGLGYRLVEVEPDLTQPPRAIPAALPRTP